MAVHHRLVLVTPVAEIVVELLQRVLVIAPVALEGDGEVFVGMGVVEGEGVGLVQRRRVIDRSCAHQQQRGRQADLEANLITGPLDRQRRDRQQIELPCEISQHVEPTQSTSNPKTFSPTGAARQHGCFVNAGGLTDVYLPDPKMVKVTR
jgi:hypothetical protein